jgi:DNA repair protein RadC
MTRVLPKSERPEEKIKIVGPGRLTNIELLTILLRSSELAEQVINLEESGVEYLTECSFEELSSVKGVGSARTSMLLAAIELGKRITQKPTSKRINIQCCADLADIFMAEMH